MFKTSEVEGEALVSRRRAPAEHVVWQEGKWIDARGRQLRPWAATEVAAANAFHVSQVREAAVRAAMRTIAAHPARRLISSATLPWASIRDAGALIARLPSAA